MRDAPTKHCRCRQEIPNIGSIGDVKLPLRLSRRPAAGVPLTVQGRLSAYSVLDRYLVADGTDEVGVHRNDRAAFVAHHALEIKIHLLPLGFIHFYACGREQLVELLVLPVGVVPGGTRRINGREHGIGRGAPIPEHHGHGFIHPDIVPVAVERRLFDPQVDASLLRHIRVKERQIFRARIDFRAVIYLRNATGDDKKIGQADAIEITPEMIQEGALRLAEIGEASVAYLAEEVFRAMITVGLKSGVYQSSLQKTECCPHKD